MPFSYRAFRKHFLRAKHAYVKLAGKGTFGLRIAAQTSTNTMTAQFTTPDDAGAVRFAALMRPFLDPSSDYHYGKVFAHIAAAAPERFSPKDYQAVEAELAVMEEGSFPIAINGRRLSARDTYDILAEGEFFNNHQAALNQLQELRKIPLFGPMAWSQFYDLTVGAYHHIARVYALSCELSRQRDSDATDADSEKPICLFCRRSDVLFTTEEHVIQEALGSDEAVLPPGVVCDPCNNELSPLDQELVDFPPIALLRVTYVANTKKGRFPTAGFDGMSLRKTHPRRIEVRSNKPPEAIRQPDGSFQIRLAVTGRRAFSPHRLARAVFKLGLELLVNDCGTNVALQPRYDAAREFVLGNRLTFANPLFLSTEGQPVPEIRTTQFACAPGTLTLIDIFGILFAFSLEETPLLNASQLPGTAPFTAFDLGTPPADNSQHARP